MEKPQRKTKATMQVLDVLLQAPTGIWGLALAKKSGLSTGTVYPILARLEDLGWVLSYWDSEIDRSGPRRKYYVLSQESILEVEEFAKKKSDPIAIQLPGAKLA